jgi:transcriptional antiterminator RfaH
MPWYAIQTKPNKERSVQAALDQAGLEVYWPRIRRPLRRGNSPSWREAALFPGYVFARFEFARDYARLRWQPGLVRVVMSGTTPLAISEATLASVREIEKEGIRHLLRPVRLKPGARVRVVQGPFAGFEGQVSMTFRSGDRVRILLELFRRQAALECDPGLLQPLASAGGL